MERELLEQMYRRYYQEIYLYVYSLCCSQSTAEDIVQDTFLKAMLSLSDSHVNMRAWLYMVARNNCFNFMKREKKMVWTDQIKDYVEESKQNQVLDQILQDERKQQLLHVISKLSVKKREVLIMQYMGGLGYKEIAPILHMTPENVRVLSHRAKKELKLIMKEEDYEI